VRRLALTAAALLAGCRAARGVAEAPAPAARDEPARGAGATRVAPGSDDAMAMYAVIVTRFFRPVGGQARWIDPRPLGDVRGAADSSAAPDDAWADAVRDATGHARVCVFDADAADACRGRDGGVLRLSAPYAVGDAEARVFVRWTRAAQAGNDGGPLPALGHPAFEMLFTMARVGRGGWRIVSQRVVNP
jgi:hypothetical protein